MEKSRSKSWVGSIYHKFEVVCQEVDEFVTKVCKCDPFWPFTTSNTLVYLLPLWLFCFLGIYMFILCWNGQNFVTILRVVRLLFDLLLKY